MRTFRSIAPPGAGGPGTDLLAAATGIGERLVREAIWYRGRCTWIGVDGSARGRRTAHRSLGPAFGDGTAGIALFLAELHAQTGADAVRRTALGAIGQALAHAGDAPERGLYGGRPGIAYAAARCGGVLGDERLTLGAARLARGRTPHGVDPSTRFDLHDGAAGSTVAYLALAQQLDDDRLVRARRGAATSSPPAPGAGAGLVLARPARRRARTLRHRRTAPPARRGRCSSCSPPPATSATPPPPSARSTTRPLVRPDARRLARPARHRAPRAAWLVQRAVRDDVVSRRARDRAQPPARLADPRRRAPARRGRARAGHDGGERRARAARARADFTLRDGLAGNADVLLLGAAALPDGAARWPAAPARSASAATPTSLDGWPSGARRRAPGAAQRARGDRAVLPATARPRGAVAAAHRRPR